MIRSAFLFVGEYLAGLGIDQIVMARPKFTPGGGVRD